MAGRSSVRTIDFSDLWPAERAVLRLWKAGERDIRTLALEAGCSDQSVRRALATLAACGLIEGDAELEPPEPDAGEVAYFERRRWLVYMAKRFLRLAPHQGLPECVLREVLP